MTTTITTTTTTTTTTITITATITIATTTTTTTTNNNNYYYHYFFLNSMSLRCSRPFPSLKYAMLAHPPRGRGGRVEIRAGDVFSNTVRNSNPFSQIFFFCS